MLFGAACDILNRVTKRTKTDERGVHMRKLKIETNEEKTVVFERKANYYETDQMGIIHHSNYIRWFEEARLFYLENSGLPYKEMEDAGIFIPVLGVTCEYKVSVKYGQTVLIYVSITEFNGIRMKCSYRVVEKETGTLCSTGTSEHCFLTKSYKPLSLKRTYPHFYEKIMEAVHNGM